MGTIFMNDFKIGDKCWTWSLTVFGSYIPFFSEYEITNIIHQENISFCCLYHEHQVGMAMPLEFIFKSKNEAIDGLIKLVEGLKDE
jgi:hypothetical protein